MEGANLAVHRSPVWQHRADSDIFVDVGDVIGADRFEQLRAKRISQRLFEICCIPFFAYDLALGDEVETRSFVGLRHLVARVTTPSGHSTFRAWFGEILDGSVRDEVVAEVERIGGLYESYSENLVSIDAPPGLAQEIAELLDKYHQTGALIYETGRT